MASGKAAAGAATPDTPSDPPAVPDVPRWVYESDDPLIYSHVPVTPSRGDVVEWPGNPGVDDKGNAVIVPGPPADDGRWKPTTDPATRWPDNHPHTIAAAEAAPIAAAEAALAQKEG